jgi:hypothetical protein
MAVAENTFVIRIWCEYSEQEDVKPLLRGVIENAVTGQRQYLICSKSILQFIQSHVHEKQIQEKSTGEHSTHDFSTHGINQLLKRQIR